MPPLKGAIGPTLGICCREEEIRRALDEGPIVGRKLCARKVFQAVGDPPALELILQAAIPLVKHDAIGHRCSPCSHWNWQMSIFAWQFIIIDPFAEHTRGRRKLPAA
jgi:hypothetical protein